MSSIYIYYHMPSMYACMHVRVSSSRSSWLSVCSLLIDCTIANHKKKTTKTTTTTKTINKQTIKRGRSKSLSVITLTMDWIGCHSHNIVRELIPTTAILYISVFLGWSSLIRSCGGSRPSVHKVLVPSSFPHGVFPSHVCIHYARRGKRKREKAPARLLGRIVSFIQKFRGAPAPHRLPSWTRPDLHYET